MNANLIWIVAAGAMSVFFLAFLIAFFLNLRLWIQALLLGVPVSILDIIRMRLRRVPPQLIVHAMLLLRQRGVKVPVGDLEGYYLAALISGERAATAAELANLVADVKRNNSDAPQA